MGLGPFEVDQPLRHHPASSYLDGEIVPVQLPDLPAPHPVTATASCQDKHSGRAWVGGPARGTVGPGSPQVLPLHVGLLMEGGGWGLLDRGGGGQGGLTLVQTQLPPGELAWLKALAEHTALSEGTAVLVFPCPLLPPSTTASRRKGDLGSQLECCPPGETQQGSPPCCRRTREGPGS